MMRLSEQLQVATESWGHLDDSGLLVRLARFTHDSYPGRDAQGILPVLVVGHESMTESQWHSWVRSVGLSHYGPGYTDRVLVNGVELREMSPTSPFGRQIRMSTEERWKSRARGWTYLDAAVATINAVEKWPSISNTIAIGISERTMALREFIAQINQLPAPAGMPDVEGRYSTLGDFIDGPIGSRPMVLPDY